MKILLVHNDYQQAGGERTAVQAQRRLLRQAGHHLIEYRRDNAEIEAYSPVEKALFFPRTIYSRRTVRELAELIEQERPDVAHVHNVFPLMTPAVYHVLASTHIPIVQTIHNFRFMCPNALFLTHGQVCERCKHGNTLHAVRLRCYRDSLPLSALYAATIGLHRQAGTFSRIDRFITFTEFSKRKLIEGGIAPAQKIDVLGNFLPDPLPAPDEHRRQPNEVLYLGRLSSEKGPELFVRAAAALPDTRFLVAGDGPERPRLEAFAQTLPARNVQFLGQVDATAKWDLLRRVQATVIPSTCYENLPFAVLESWAVATPVIVSAIGSLPYVVSDGIDGMTFPANDVDRLQARLQEMLADPILARQMGYHGRTKLEREYSEAVHYKKLMAVYKDVMPPKSQRAES